MEDMNMSSPPNEDNDTSNNSLDIPDMDSQKKLGDLSPISPHSKDRPAPLFSSSSDPNKTPTPMSPVAPDSPKMMRNSNEDTAAEMHQECDASVIVGDDAEILPAIAETDTEEETVVGDYLKIMFVKYKVVSTILVSRLSLSAYLSH
jgi:hypothetical protein